MREVVILDQFVGPTPIGLRETPMSFAELRARAEAGEYDGTMSWRVAKVTEVAEDFRPDMATTVFAADEKGMAFAWRYSWDSSG